ncbi:hypothetical protein WDW86_15455 [Bdellovibrionota bacterium FG-2]
MESLKVNMRFKTHEAISFKINPITTSVKIGSSPIDYIYCTSNFTIAVAGHKSFLLGTYCPGKPRRAKKDEVDLAKKQRRPTSFRCTPSLIPYEGKPTCTMTLRRKGGAPYNPALTGFTPKQGDIFKTPFFLDGDDHLFWASPDEVRVVRINPQRSYGATTFSIPGLMPSALSYRNGLLVIGTMDGELRFMSFWPNAIHLILSLENELYRQQKCVQLKKQKWRTYEK